MNLNSNKKDKIPYSVTVTMWFPVYMSPEDEDEGTEIPEEIIKEGVLKAIENKEYDVQEDSME